MKLKKRRVNRGKIGRIGEILEEFLIGNFESEFPVSAPAVEREFPVEPPPEAVEAERKDVEEQHVGEDPEAELYDETKYYFDLADVEYCVDVAITEIVKEKLVPGYDNPKKPPTLSEIFQSLFGEEHILTKQVYEFEELISGYDDRVHIDDLQQAHNVISEVVKELKDWSGN